MLQTKNKLCRLTTPVAVQKTFGTMPYIQHHIEFECSIHRLNKKQPKFVFWSDSKIRMKNLQNMKENSASQSKLSYW